MCGGEMKHFFKILARRNRDCSHREIKVTIDWTGITKEDLMVLAKNALINDIHASVRKGEGPFPTELFISAKDVVHHDSPALMEYQPPPPKVDKKLEELLKQLSPDELKMALKII
jgi:hypothetical protein